MLQSSRTLVFAPLARACAGSDKLFVDALIPYEEESAARKGDRWICSCR